MLRGYISLSRLREITIIGILTAVIVATRMYLQFLPNIKPVTPIIIISVIAFDVWFGIKLSIVSTLVSSLFLGMGAFVPFQILAWVLISCITEIVLKFCKRMYLFPMALFSGAMGYVYGFIVSFEKLFYMNFPGFVTYYISGLYFDTLHAAGNFAFYLCFAPLLLKIFREQKNGTVKKL